MSIRQEIIKTLQWPYIRHNEQETLETALNLIGRGLKLPYKLSQDVENILERYA